ncbi:MAG: DUF192 domain-containing protein [Candidatus Omnitrophota bacterium]|nr:DUF192 domain-containing protein [Candidatus Omnitrophota bacterium]
MRAINISQGTTLAQKLDVADNFFTRLKGLLGEKELAKGNGLLIKSCNSIHTFFMRFAIDAIFVDKNNKVVGLVKNLKPFRLSPIFFNASFVIELPCQTIAETHTQIGDYISLL